ncbi:quinone oxidoreductase putative [Auricularia subglabra TFB-10046 SS5]|nr:quinone oxidoreductase putative [Auricularia subglabra TFB-10046 SS5]
MSKKVLVQDGRGPVEHLHIGETAVPAVETHEVLVRVKAFGLNRMDIFQRMGYYPVPPGTSQILGVEFSGTVFKVGEGVQGWSEGDEVFGRTGGGAYAEYVTVPHGNLMRKPPSLSWAEAASIPEAFITAFQALVQISDLQKGESVLIHAGASRVGVAANQLARFLGAENVITTAGTDAKLEWLRNIGVTRAANYKTEDFSQIAKDATGGRGVNVVIDFVGKSHWEKNIGALAVDGRLVLLATLSGADISDVNLMPILFKRLRIQGSTLRSQSEGYQAKLIKRFSDTVAPHITSKDGDGQLRTYIHKMETSANIGKIIVEVV